MDIMSMRTLKIRFSVLSSTMFPPSICLVTYFAKIVYPVQFQECIHSTISASTRIQREFLRVWSQKGKQKLCLGLVFLRQSPYLRQSQGPLVSFCACNSSGQICYIPGCSLLWFRSKMFSCIQAPALDHQSPAQRYNNRTKYTQNIYTIVTKGARLIGVWCWWAAGSAGGELLAPSRLKNWGATYFW